MQPCTGKAAGNSDGNKYKIIIKYSTWNSKYLLSFKFNIIFSFNKELLNPPYRRRQRCVFFQDSFRNSNAQFIRVSINADFYHVINNSRFNLFYKLLETNIYNFEVEWNK